MKRGATSRAVPTARNQMSQELWAAFCYPQIALVSATRGEGVCRTRVPAWWGRGARGLRRMRLPISARVWVRCGAARGAGEIAAGLIAALLHSHQEVGDGRVEELAESWLEGGYIPVPAAIFSRCPVLPKTDTSTGQRRPADAHPCIYHPLTTRQVFSKGATRKCVRLPAVHGTVASALRAGWGVVAGRDRVAFQGSKVESWPALPRAPY